MVSVSEPSTNRTDVSAQFKKGILEMCILTLVRRRDYYGYELVEEISKKIQVHEGTVYPILRRLTKDGYFLTYLQESNEGPPRKYYRITPLGRTTQTELVLNWREFNKNVNSLLKFGEKNEPATLFG